MDNFEKAKLEIKIKELERRISNLEFIVRKNDEYNDKDIKRLEENDHKIVDLIDEIARKN
tara:strand:- start:474 stop:653 length:180 start_codon:yes stop_codon:yes gene_type:complete